MNAVQDDVVKLVDKELESANKKFPMFRSAHEGYAVILEELDEVKDELESIDGLLALLWRGIKENNLNGTPICHIYHNAISLACEAIQVAAMAKEFQESMKKLEANNE